MFNTVCSRTFVRTRVLFASLTRHTLRLWALTRPSAQQSRALSREDGAERTLYVTKLVTYRVCGAILNAVYRERAGRTRAHCNM